MNVLERTGCQSCKTIDLIPTLISDEVACRSKRLLVRRRKRAQFRHIDKRLDNFNFEFNAKMSRNLVIDSFTAGRCCLLTIRGTGLKYHTSNRLDRVRFGFQSRMSRRCLVEAETGRHSRWIIKPRKLIIHDQPFGRIVSEPPAIRTEPHFLVISE